MNNIIYNKIRKDFDSLYSFSEVLSTEQECIEYFEKIRWGNNVISPFEPNSKVYKYKNNVYRCKNTGKNFTVTTGTMFHSSNLPLRKWFLAIWLNSSYKKGISSIQLSKEINVTQTTAWKMLQKIRKSYIFENQWKLNNIVESDETFVGGKNKNRHRDKKVKNSQGRSFKDKTPVLGLIERNGKLVARVIKNTSFREITPVVLKFVNRSATIYTDEWDGYRLVKKIYNHEFIDHSRKQYANGDICTNTIEGFWSILKRGIIGIYHFVSRKYLQNYVNEFVFRYNTRNISNKERFDLFLNKVF
jgi:hypothetical protein